VCVCTWQESRIEITEIVTEPVGMEMRLGGGREEREDLQRP
jgi:hypothetical protein